MLTLPELPTARLFSGKTFPLATPLVSFLRHSVYYSRFLRDISPARFQSGISLHATITRLTTSRLLRHGYACNVHHSNQFSKDVSREKYVFRLITCKGN